MQSVIAERPRLVLRVATIAIAIAALGALGAVAIAPAPTDAPPPSLMRSAGAAPEPIEVIAAPAAPSTRAIEVVASATHTHVAPGKPLPISFSVVNRSSQPVTALRSLDGSDVGWRYPKIDIEIRDPEGNLVVGNSIARCGLVNPLVASDFVTIAPGGAMDLIGEGTFGHYQAQAPAVPGRYTVRLRYDLSFGGDDRAHHGDDLQPAIDTLPRGVYESEPITFDVVGF